jgi:hypothetical protein
MDAGANGVVRRKRKLTALPLLVVLFVISYSLLTRLVIEQDKTIDAQRSLIHQLFHDAISHSKSEKHARKAPPVQVPMVEIPSNQLQSNQVQSNQVQPNQAQSGQVGPQANAKTARKPRRRVSPFSPPAQLTDPSDMRRVTFSI